MRICLALLAVMTGMAVPAFAERVPFTRTFDVGASPTLEVTTGRGKIAIRPGTSGRIVVHGTVTVRVGTDVPADAMAIASRVAAAPPVGQAGDAVRLATPSDSRERRAVTVSYDVEVPPATRVTTVSGSGATSVEGVEGGLSIKTQSAAIAVQRTRGDATVATGSGAVRLDDLGGSMDVTSSSGSVTANAVRGGLRVQTGSGAVDAALAGPGPVHVRTSSSGVRLRGLAGAADVETGSGRIVVLLVPDAALRLEASTGSGAIDLRGIDVAGDVGKRRVTGTIGAAGADVRLVSRSGSIRLER